MKTDDPTLCDALSISEGDSAASFKGKEAKSKSSRGGKGYQHYPRELKFRVALEALQGRLTQVELGEKYDIPQPVISHWKKTAVEALREAFGNRASKAPLDPSKLVRSSGVDSADVLPALLRKAAALLEQGAGG